MKESNMLRLKIILKSSDYNNCRMHLNLDDNDSDDDFFDDFFDE